MEARWLRWIGPGIVSVGLVTALGSSVVVGGDGSWDPPACPDGPMGRIVAARDVRVSASGAPWYAIGAVLDATGSLSGERLELAGGATDAPRSIALPAESFASGPFGRVVLVGADDGSVSSLRAIDTVAGCAWSLATETSVIRRATLSPDGVMVYETRVDRTSRADLGVWRRMTDGTGRAERVLGPVGHDARFGPTWSTEFAWSVDGDRLAVQSCGATSCRTRLLDPATGAVTLVSDPGLGPMVGLTADRLVSHRPCRGFPCALVATDPETGGAIVLDELAGPAVVTGHGPGVRVVHERFDGRGGRRLRSVDLSGRLGRDLGAIDDGLRLVLDPWQARGLPRPDPGWVLLAPDGRGGVGPTSPLPIFRRADDGAILPVDEVLR